MGLSKAKVYLSDEGFGHIVRQRLLIEALDHSNNDFEFTIQTKNHFEMATRLLLGDNKRFINKFNNIRWFKDSSGSPDLIKIKNYYNNYNQITNDFVKSEIEDFDFDFVISDFVHEAFSIASLKKKPSFGVAHFTWDWFFSKLYPSPVKRKLLNSFVEAANKSTELYFSPFTPEEIIRHYGKKARRVPLIVRGSTNGLQKIKSDAFKILLIDSGSNVLKSSIKKALASFTFTGEIELYMSEHAGHQTEGLKYISKNDLLIDHIGQMDLVIGRGGFNTISECIAMRTPILLIAELGNPEMAENLINLKFAGLASFISVHQFENNLQGFLSKFINHEYEILLENMNNHQIETNGAEVIAAHIMDHIS